MGYKSRQQMKLQQKMKRKQRRQKAIKAGRKVEDLFYGRYYMGEHKSKHAD